MFTSTHALLALAVIAPLTTAQSQTDAAQKVGWTGTLSTLDGGLGGLVTVINSTALSIASYTLKDASAPALYWWGTTDGILKDGFRISNAQVKEAAKTNTLLISLDAGKTTADFTTVGLWCEKLSANFGQATLAAAAASGGSVPPTTATTPGAAAPAPSATGAKSGAAGTFASATGIVSSLVAAAILVAWL